MSERGAYQLVGLSRSTLPCEPGRSEGNEQLRTQIVEPAQTKRRFGYRRIHALLGRDGVEANRQRLYRLYRKAADLTVERQKQRKGVAIPRQRVSWPTQYNEVRSMGFVMGALSHGRRIKMLTIVAGCTGSPQPPIARAAEPQRFSTLAGPASCAG